MSNLLKVHTLGSLNIQYNGVNVPFTLAKAKALVVYLALTRQPQSREHLADLLWNEGTQALTNLRPVLATLRKQFPDHILISHQSVGLNNSVWVDAFKLEDGIRNAQTELDETGYLTPQSTEHLAAVFALYKGDFLADFYVRDAPNLEAWVRIEQERLRRLIIEATQRLVDYYTEKKTFTSGISHARRLLQLDPLREHTHRQLMLLLAQKGERSEALRQYEVCRQSLSDELGIQPEAETTTLYDKIRTGELYVATRMTRPPSGLPVQSTSFIGRQSDLARIAEYLSLADCRLLTLIGPGGIGKTRLALQAVSRPFDGFRHGIHFIALAPVSSAHWLASAIATAFNYSLASTEPPETQLINYLREKHMLLILDNFEHLLAGVDFINALLSAAPGVKILVTSRERLNLMKEWIVAVEGLSYPASIGDPDLAKYDAVQLFTQSAQRVQAGFSLTGNAEAIIEICRVVDGMPLGLELAATWLRVIPARQIAPQIARDIGFLRATIHDLPERHQSLRAVFDQSWRLLSEAEQSALAALSVFRGGFESEAAKAVADASQGLLASLIDKSLIRTSSEGRYDLHERLRQYAGNQLELTMRRDDTLRSHALYYVCFLHENENTLRGHGQLAVMQAIAADWNNIRAAVDWVIDHRDFDAMNRLMECLFQYSLEFRVVDLQDIWRRALAAFAPLSDEAPHPAYGRLLSRAAYALFVKSNSPAALADQTEQRLAHALQIARQHNDMTEICFTLWAYGHMWFYRDEDQRAIGCFEESLKFAGQSENDIYEIYAIHWQGMAYLKLGNTQQGIARLKQSIAMYQAMGNDFEAAWVKYSLGNHLCLLGQVREGEQYLRESRAGHLVFGSPFALMLCNINLAEVALWRGDLAEAATIIGNVLEVAEDRNIILGQVFGQRTLGALRCLQERYDDAEAIFDGIMASAQNFHDTNVLRWGRMMIAWAHGDFVSAKQHMQEHYQKSGDAYRGIVAALVLPIQALLAYPVEPERAAKLLGLAFSQPPELTGWLNIWPPAAKLHSELNTRLGPVAYDAAWAAGAALSLDQAANLI